MKTYVVSRGDALLDYRIRAGYSKAALAAVAAVPHSSIVRAEQGRNITPKTATSLCKVLNVPFDDLFAIEKRG